MDRFPHQAWMSSPPVQAVLAALGAPAIDVRFVGGCVRDAVLGRSIGDVDIATPDTPDIVMSRLRGAGLKAVPTGVEFGTVTAVAEGEGFQITTLRRDTACDGRHADVEYTDDWAEDAARRDFTFNAMSLKPDGELFDPYNGVADAHAGRVRFVGNPRDRIIEDYLRILRFFRFHAHYGATAPDDDAVQACTDLRDGLTRLSAERRRDELVKLLAAPRPEDSLEVMLRSGVLAAVLPYANSKTLESVKALIGSCERQALPERPARWLCRFAALVPGEAYAAAAEALVLSKADSKTLEDLRRACREMPPIVDTPKINRFLYRWGAEIALTAVTLVEAQGATGSVGEAVWRAAKTWQSPVFPLGGKDLAAEGIRPGPEMGTLLKDLEEAWIESGFTESRAALLERLKALRAD